MAAAARPLSSLPDTTLRTQIVVMSPESGKVLWHVTMSLDGFIAGRGDAMDLVFKLAAGPDAEVDEVLRTLGALLVGRRSYDVGQRAKRPEMRKAYGGAWTGPQIVLTHAPPSAPPDETITFLSSDIDTAVETALGVARGRTSSSSAPTSPGSASRPDSWTRSSFTWRRCCWVTASACSPATAPRTRSRWRR